jgi:predicted transcriptional regulator
MTITISISDELSSAADVLAGDMGLTRDELFEAALAEYLARHDRGTITDRLNRAHADDPSGLDACWVRLQREAIGPEEW